VSGYKIRLLKIEKTIKYVCYNMEKEIS